MAVIFWGIVVLACSFLFGSNKSTVIEIINAIGSVFYGPVLVTFLLAIFSKRVNAIGMNTGILTAVFFNLLFSGTIQEIFNFDPGVKIFWIWLNFTGVVVSLLVAYLVSAFTKGLSKPSDSKIDFKVTRADVMSKEVFILAGFFVIILVFSYFVPSIFGS